MQTFALAFTPRFITLTLCLADRGHPRRRRGDSRRATGRASSAPSRWSSSRCRALGLRDLVQTRHAVLRNYPISAHLRFILEDMRPEMRQYFFESETDGLPFSRNQRALVYQRAKMQLDKRPFGTQLDVYAQGYEFLSHSIAPREVDPKSFRIIDRRPGLRAALFGLGVQYLGDEFRLAQRQRDPRAQPRREARRLRPRHRRGRLQPLSSRRAAATSSGSSAPAISAAATSHGRFDPEAIRRRRRQSADQDDRDQAQPGRQARARRRAAGGQGHARKSRAIRGVPMGQDCISPARHSAFATRSR